uniref:Uncharacterized protein n=1 Tax=Daucus carota subsp. sativus TaxID=79200 RepID=A0A165X7C4_DAUCS
MKNQQLQQFYKQCTYKQQPNYHKPTNITPATHTYNTSIYQLYINKQNHF